MVPTNPLPASVGSLKEPMAASPCLQGSGCLVTEGQLWGQEGLGALDRSELSSQVHPGQTGVRASIFASALAAVSTGPLMNGSALRLARERRVVLVRARWWNSKGASPPILLNSGGPWGRSQCHDDPSVTCYCPPLSWLLLRESATVGFDLASGFSPA